MAAPKILIVDDEPNIVASVKYNLEREGFRVVSADDGRKAVDLAVREVPDLVLLDWMLPGLDGLEVCRALRGHEATRTVPIIMVTVRSEETDKVVGLEVGADDFVTKPFSPRELVARIKAHLRRGQAPPSAERFVLDELEVDWGRRTVTVKGKPVELTRREFDLLHALIEAKGRVLSREALLDRVWGYERSIEIETRTVDLHVSQLRRKLKKAGERIVTVTGVGYRMLSDA